MEYSKYEYELYNRLGNMAAANLVNQPESRTR